MKAKGAEVVAIGTGDVRYAKAFVDDESVPFPVLVDDKGEAARAASVKKASALSLVAPRNFKGRQRASGEGHRQRALGERPMQLGATFVVGPGDAVHYEHLDSAFEDHAPLDDVIAAVPT